MYGTLENKNESGDGANGDGPTSTTTATSQTATSYLQSQANQDGRRNKRLHSHCHVQPIESHGQGGGMHQVDKSARRRLITTSIICLIFMIGEVVGGVLSNSLAIAADAAHLLTDFASFMISLFAIWLSSRPASKRMSFGWYRAEVIGALISVLMIWLVTGLLVYMAIERIRTEEFEINSLVMVITASAGLLVNIIMAVVLSVDGHSHGFHSHGHGHQHHNHNHANHSHQDHINEDDKSCERQHIQIFENGIRDTSLEAKLKQSANDNSNQFQTLPHVDSGTGDNHKHPDNHNHDARGRGKSNINVRAAFVHVIGDFLQSLGVLIAALVIHFEPSYAIVDPICTFIFSFIVLVTTINILRDATNVLMEGIPDGINFIEVRERLQSLPSVIRVHNLRIWSLSLDKIAISTHLVIDNSQAPSQVLKDTIYLLKSSYNFFEVTIQIEEYKDDMKDCEHCQEEEVVVKVVDGGGSVISNNGSTGSNMAHFKEEAQPGN